MMIIIIVIIIIIIAIIIIIIILNQNNSDSLQCSCNNINICNNHRYCWLFFFFSPFFFPFLFSSSRWNRSCSGLRSLGLKTRKSFFLPPHSRLENLRAIFLNISSGTNCGLCFPSSSSSFFKYFVRWIVRTFLSIEETALCRIQFIENFWTGNIFFPLDE